MKKQWSFILAALMTMVIMVMGGCGGGGGASSGGNNQPQTTALFGTVTFPSSTNTAKVAEATTTAPFWR